MSKNYSDQNIPHYSQPDLFSEQPVTPNYQQFPEQGRKGSGGKKLLFVVLGLGGGFLVLLCCGGGVGVSMLGLNVLTEEINLEVRDHPVIQEHIGEIQSFKMAFAKSLAKDDEDTFVYRLEGTKGKGELTVASITDFDGQEEIISASLRMASGETYELDFDE